jgi:hypothetical protein
MIFSDGGQPKQIVCQILHVDEHGAVAVVRWMSCNPGYVASAAIKDQHWLDNEPME